MSIGRFEIKNKHTKAKKKKKPLSASYFLKEQTSFWQVTQPALPHLRGVAVNTTVSLVAVDRHRTYLCATTPALFNLSLFFGKEIQRRRRRMGKKKKQKKKWVGRGQKVPPNGEKVVCLYTQIHFGSIHFFLHR